MNNHPRLTAGMRHAGLTGPQSAFLRARFRNCARRPKATPARWSLIQALELLNRAPNHALQILLARRCYEVGPDFRAHRRIETVFHGGRRIIGGARRFPWRPTSSESKKSSSPRWICRALL